jgi:hypothetical protein
MRFFMALKIKNFSRLAWIFRLYGTPSVTHNACVIKSAEYFHDITVKKTFATQKLLVCFCMTFLNNKVFSAQ